VAESTTGQARGRHVRQKKAMAAGEMDGRQNWHASAVAYVAVVVKGRNGNGMNQAKVVVTPAATIRHGGKPPVTGRAVARAGRNLGIR